MSGYSSGVSLASVHVLLAQNVSSSGRDEHSFSRAVTSTVILFIALVGIVLLAVISLTCYRICLIIFRKEHETDANVRENRTFVSVITTLTSSRQNTDPEVQWQPPWNTPPPAYKDIGPPPAYSEVVKERTDVSKPCLPPQTNVI